MAVTEANLQKFVGFGNVFLDATLPTDFGTPVITGGTPAAGTDIGATIGGAEFHYKANMTAWNIDQSTSPILPAVDTEEVTIIARMAEFSYTNLQKLMQTHARLVGGTREVLHLGGNLDVTGHSVCIVAEMPSAPGKYYGAMIYNAWVDNEVNVPIKRGDTTRVIEVTFRGQSITSRPKGDQIGQWFEDQ